MLYYIKSGTLIYIKKNGLETVFTQKCTAVWQILLIISIMIFLGYLFKWHNI